MSTTRLGLVAMTPATQSSEVPTFQTLYRQHVDGLWRLLRRLGVPEAQLPDAAQDVFLVAFRKLPDFRAESQLKTWLTGIALRVAKDYRRSMTRRGVHESLDDVLERPQPQGLPDEAAMSRQALERVLTLLDQLDPELRTVFVLTEFEGLTAPEIMELTQTNLNTVYTRLRKARACFNELVEKAGLP